MFAPKETKDKAALYSRMRSRKVRDSTSLPKSQSLSSSGAAGIFGRWLNFPLLRQMLK